MGDRKKTNSALKISLNSIISVIVMTGTMLIGIFVLDKIQAIPQNSLEYWASKIINAIATFALSMSVANIVEEALKKKDKDYNDRADAIADHYKDVMAGHETDEIELYIENINRANKYKAFVEHYKRKLNKVKPNNQAKRELVENRLLMTPQEVWDDIANVRYNKVTWAQLIAGEYDVNSKDDEYDLQVHKGRQAVSKLFVKLIMLVAFGAVTADFAFHFVEFDKTMIMPLVIKAVTLLMAVYSGVSFGYSMIDKRKQTMKKKLRIFSQFRQRIERKDVQGDKCFVVEIPTDVVVEKIRKKYETKE